MARTVAWPFDARVITSGAVGGGGPSTTRVACARAETEERTSSATATRRPPIRRPATAWEGGRIPVVYTCFRLGPILRKSRNSVRLFGGAGDTPAISILTPSHPCPATACSRRRV